MLRVIVVLFTIGVTVYALIDCARSDSAQLKGLPKWVWLLLIVLLAPVGGLIWIVVSRQSPDGPAPRGIPRVVAPDDDPDFLRSLEERKRLERRREERRRKERNKDDNQRGDGAEPTAS